MKISEMKTHEQVVEEEYANDPEFRAEWDRTAFARQVSVAVTSYRSKHGLTQAAFARQLGTTQSVVARIEIGEQPPSWQTLAKLTAGTGLIFDVHLADGRADVRSRVPARRRRREPAAA